MQREIKFRGKRYDDKNWIYGSLLEDNVIVTKGATSVDEDYIGFDDDWSSVLSETVGQYTGLKDKNGKEIYEGDIVEIGDCKAVIKWDKKSASFYAFDENHDVRTTHIAYANLTKVIGNVHDNPKLLQEVNKNGKQ